MRRKLHKKKEVPYIPSARDQAEACGFEGPHYFEMDMMKTKRLLEAAMHAFWTREDYPERRAIAEANGDLKTKLTDGKLKKVVLGLC